MKNFINKLKCFFVGCIPGVKDRYLDKSGNYFFTHKCTRCDELLGLPNLTEKYMSELYPIPPMPRKVNYINQ